MNKYLICTMVCALFFVACQQGEKQRERSKKQIVTGESFSFKPVIKYATCFNIELHDGYKTIMVTNPWKKLDTLASYVLYPKGIAKPDNLPSVDFEIPVPIGEIATLSSTHIGFIELLGELEKIVGVSSGDRIYNKQLSEKFKKGALLQIGSNMNNNLEVIFDLSPELLMKTGFDHVRNEDKRILNAGIPIAYNIEWMESDMLGRAEWIKFVGAFFNKDAIADSVFKEIEKNYLEVAKLAQSAEYKPTILSGNNFKGTWYMPGGKSYAAQLIADAGGDYHYKNDSSKGSIPLSLEVVLDNMVDAAYWLGSRAKSLHELERMDERYTLFKAFKTGNVFTKDKRVNANGGNDYWESGVVRPDIILKDVIKILHPNLLPEYKLFYYRKLQ